MHLRYLLLMVALAGCQDFSAWSQGLGGQSFESVLALPRSRDSVRLWHRYLGDTSVALLIPAGANGWLKRGYEFRIPVGPVTSPVEISMERLHRDSVMLSCMSRDQLSCGYRFLFCREAGGWSFRAAWDFQIFRSGIERLCTVPVSSLDKADRRVITPQAGAGMCSYMYHRKAIVTFPGPCYVVP